MPSLDTFPVSADGRVRCPLRQKELRLSTCLVCERLIEVDPADPPTHIICDARYAMSFLGLDDDP